MKTSNLVILICRDLSKLKLEIESYPNEKQIWKIDKLIANSAGNLCLHLIGNLNAYIGATLGNTGYIRQRDSEFSLKDVPRSELVNNIEQTIQMIQQVLPTLTQDQLALEYPMLVLKEKTTTEYFLIHLAMHLSYHLGQVYYHRRLVD